MNHISYSEMDFHGMKRKELQALCKKHSIPANLTNLEMADKLTSLLKEKEKQVTRGRSCLKSLVGENDPEDVKTQFKKVRFSPENEMFEFVKSGAKATKVGRRKPMTRALTKNKDLVVENVDSVNLSEELLDNKPVRVTRSRTQKPMDGGVIPLLSPAFEKKSVLKHVDRSDELPPVIDLNDNTTSDYAASEVRRVPERRSMRSKKVVDDYMGDEDVGIIAVSKKIDIKGSDEVSESKAPLEDGGITRPLKAFRRSNRNSTKVEDFEPPVNTELSKNEMIERGRTTRSRAQLSVKGSSGLDINIDTEIKHKVQGVSEQPSGLPGRNRATKKSIMRQAEFKDEVHGKHEVVLQLEEPSKHLGRKGNRRKPTMRRIEEVGTDQPEVENENRKSLRNLVPESGSSTEVPKENEMVSVPEVPLRRSRRNTSMFKFSDPSLTDEELGKQDIVGKDELSKQSMEPFVEKKGSQAEDHVKRSKGSTYTDDSIAIPIRVDEIANAVEKNMPRKRRRHQILEKETVETECDSFVEEPPRRSRRTTTKTESVAPAVFTGNIRKNELEGRSKLKTIEVKAPSSEDTSAIKEPPITDTQLIVTAVAKLAGDPVLSSRNVVKDASTGKKSSRKSHAKKQEGFKEACARTSDMERARGLVWTNSVESSDSKSVELQIDHTEQGTDILISESVLFTEKMDISLGPVLDKSPQDYIPEANESNSTSQSMNITKGFGYNTLVEPEPVEDLHPAGFAETSFERDDNSFIDQSGFMGKLKEMETEEGPSIAKDIDSSCVVVNYDAANKSISVHKDLNFVESEEFDVLPKPTIHELVVEEDIAVYYGSVGSEKNSENATERTGEANSTSALDGEIFTCITHENKDTEDGEIITEAAEPQQSSFRSWIPSMEVGDTSTKSIPTIEKPQTEVGEDDRDTFLSCGKVNPKEGNEKSKLANLVEEVDLASRTRDRIGDSNSRNLVDPEGVHQLTSIGFEAIAGKDSFFSPVHESDYTELLTNTLNLGKVIQPQEPSPCNYGTGVEADSASEDYTIIVHTERSFVESVELTKFVQMKDRENDSDEGRESSFLNTSEEERRANIMSQEKDIDTSEDSVDTTIVRETLSVFPVVNTTLWPGKSTENRFSAGNLSSMEMSSLKPNVVSKRQEEYQINGHIFEGSKTKHDGSERILSYAVEISDRIISKHDSFVCDADAGIFNQERKEENVSLKETFSKEVSHIRRASSALQEETGDRLEGDMCVDSSSPCVIDESDTQFATVRGSLGTDSNCLPVSGDGRGNMMLESFNGEENRLIISEKKDAASLIVDSDISCSIHTSLKDSDASEQGDQLKFLFATPVNSSTKAKGMLGSRGSKHERTLHKGSAMPTTRAEIAEEGFKEEDQLKSPFTKPFKSSKPVYEEASPHQEMAENATPLDKTKISKVGDRRFSQGKPQELVGANEDEHEKNIHKKGNAIRIENLEITDGGFGECWQEDHLKFLFATPVNSTSPHKVKETSGHKTEMADIAMFVDKSINEAGVRRFTQEKSQEMVEMKEELFGHHKGSVMQTAGEGIAEEGSKESEEEDQLKSLFTKPFKSAKLIYEEASHHQEMADDAIPLDRTIISKVGDRRFSLGEPQELVEASEDEHEKTVHKKGNAMPIENLEITDDGFGESWQEGQLKVLFATPVNSTSPHKVKETCGHQNEMADVAMPVDKNITEAGVRRFTQEKSQEMVEMKENERGQILDELIAFRTAGEEISERSCTESWRDNQLKDRTNPFEEAAASDNDLEYLAMSVEKTSKVRDGRFNKGESQEFLEANGSEEKIQKLNTMPTNGEQITDEGSNEAQVVLQVNAGVGSTLTEIMPDDCEASEEQMTSEFTKRSPKSIRGKGMLKEKNEVILLPAGPLGFDKLVFKYGYESAKRNVNTLDASAVALFEKGGDCEERSDQATKEKSDLTSLGADVYCKDTDDVLSGINNGTLIENSEVKFIHSNVHKVEVVLEMDEYASTVSEKLSDVKGGKIYDKFEEILPLVNEVKFYDVASEQKDNVHELDKSAFLNSYESVPGISEDGNVPKDTAVGGISLHVDELKHDDPEGHQDVGVTEEVEQKSHASEGNGMAEVIPDNKVNDTHGSAEFDQNSGNAPTVASKPFHEEDFEVTKKKDVGAITRSDDFTSAMDGSDIEKNVRTFVEVYKEQPVNDEDAVEEGSSVGYIVNQPLNTSSNSNEIQSTAKINESGLSYNLGEMVPCKSKEPAEVQNSADASSSDPTINVNTVAISSFNPLASQGYGAMEFKSEFRRFSNWEINMFLGDKKEYEVEESNEGVLKNNFICDSSKNVEEVKENVAAMLFEEQLGRPEHHMEEVAEPKGNYLVASDLPTSESDEEGKENVAAILFQEQLGVAEHHMEEVVEPKGNHLAASDLSNSEHDEILKESDVADVIEEYIVFGYNEKVSVNVEDSTIIMQDKVLTSNTEVNGSTHAALVDLKAEGEFNCAEVVNIAKVGDNNPSVGEKCEESTEEIALREVASKANSMMADQSPAFIDFAVDGGFATNDVLAWQEMGDSVQKGSPNAKAEESNRPSAKQLHSTTMKKKNAKTSSIHGTPKKLLTTVDMKENAPSTKKDHIGNLATVKSAIKRRALGDLQNK